MAYWDEWEQIPNELKAKIPKGLFEGLDLYVREHIETGGFLRAVLENDLFYAVRHAHPESLRALPSLVECLLYAPSACYGSRENVATWIAACETRRDYGLCARCGVPLTGPGHPIGTGEHPRPCICDKCDRAQFDAERALRWAQEGKTP